MRIRKRERIAPINMMAGDSIALTYEEEDGQKRVLVHDTVDRSMVVDEAIVFDLEEHERDELGVDDAIGGLFARRRPFRDRLRQHLGRTADSDAT